MPKQQLPAVLSVLKITLSIYAGTVLSGERVAPQVMGIPTQEHQQSVVRAFGTHCSCNTAGYPAVPGQQPPQ